MQYLLPHNDNCMANGDDKNQTVIKTHIKTIFIFYVSPSNKMTFWWSLFLLWSILYLYKKTYITSKIFDAIHSHSISLYLRSPHYTFTYYPFHLITILFFLPGYLFESCTTLLRDSWNTLFRTSIYLLYYIYYYIILINNSITIGLFI